MGLAAGSAALAAQQQIQAASPVPSASPPATPQPASPTLALMGLAAGSAALAAQQQIQAASPVPSASPPATPQPASPTLALMGLAAGSAALSIADRFRSSQSQPAPDGTRLLPTGTAPPFAVAPPSPMTMFMGSESGTAVLDATLTTDTPGRGMIAPVSPFAVTPEMGQLTLMAPPLQIASTQAERGGIAASVDWQTLAVGVGPLDEGGLSRLKQVLPMQTSVLYPALPPGSLGQGAVNLPLSASLVQSLLQKGYGNPGMGTATRAVDMATSAGGGKPPAAPLTAQIIPGRRPAGAAAGVFGHPDEMQGGAGALGQAGKGQAARGGVLDFLGLPVRLAPSLGGRSDLARETTLRSTGQGLIKPQQTLRPEQFAPLRNRLFPAFSSMAVEPDKAAWRKAAPAFGLRDGSPTTLLAPDARIPVQTPTMSQPPSRSRPPVSSPSAALLGGPHEASLISPLMAVAGHRAAVTPGHPGTPSAYTPSASLTHGLPPAVGAWAAAHTPLQGLGGSLTAPVRGPSLSFPAAYPPTHGRHGAPLTAIYPGPASSGPGLGPSGLGVIGGVGHHLPLGASLHHPSSRASHASHAPPPFSQVPSALGAAHLPSGLAYRRAMPESLPGSGPFLGVGSLAQNRLATTPRSRGGAFLLPAASVVGSSTRSSTGGGSHTTFPTALPGPAGGLSGRRLPRSGAFVPLGGRSVSHSRLAHTNARPLGSHLSLPTSRPVSSLHPVSASGPSLGNAPGSSHTPGDGGGRRIASPGFIGSPSAALALPHRTLTPMHFPDSRIVRSPGPTSPVTTRAVWPESLTPVSRRQKGGGVVGGFGGPAPAMRLAPPRPVRRTDVDTSATPPMTIQRSETTTTATPAQNRSAQPHTKAASGPSGSVAGEVNALAGEVWSLLKRRLATEAERRGRW